MPRVYKRQLGSRRYRDYSDEVINEVVAEIKRGSISLRKASEKYNIPTGTLSRKVRNIQQGKVGRPLVLSDENENDLEKAIILVSEWGFPLTTFDIRIIVKHFLDKRGLNEPRFSKNLPGLDWIQGFLARHSEVLSERLCQNIKRQRAAVSCQTINDYFRELKKSATDVAPEAIINYDETNMTDDPGRVKVIVRRGSKHPDRIIDHSKASTSVMFAGTASGTLLPPYVCYKAGHLYDTWTLNGPPGTKYNRTKSSWFNTVVFEDWFESIALVYFKKLPKDSPKIIVGDNLATHISINVIQLCKEYNIRFLLLPPNSTHLCQPLDVSFFRPLKAQWRQVLTDWKSKNRGCVPKDRFPALLKQSLQNLDKAGAIERNLKAGFKATGICPLNADAVLKRLPDKEADQEGNTSLTEALKEFLQESRLSQTAPLRHKKND
jgi:hypothetical protein